MVWRFVPVGVPILIGTTLSSSPPPPPLGDPVEACREGGMIPVVGMCSWLLAFAQGFALELDPVCIVDQPIEDGVGDGRITEPWLPRPSNGCYLPGQ